MFSSFIYLASWSVVSLQLFLAEVLGRLHIMTQPEEEAKETRRRRSESVMNNVRNYVTNGYREM
jgi:hypothetical protein